MENNDIKLIELNSFEPDISNIDLGYIYLGTRYEIDDDFFEDYDSIIYSLNPRLVLFSKVKYPDGKVFYYDFLGNIDAPVSGCDMNGKLAKYEIKPHCPLIEYLVNKENPHLSISDLISLLSTDLQDQVLGKVSYKELKK